VRASIGGFAFTATLRRTCGNLDRHRASEASVSPVSAATPSRASAERMPSPAGEWSRTGGPRLLAAEVRAEALHLLGHVAVPHLGLDDADARGVERLVQAEVGMTVVTMTFPLSRPRAAR